MSEFICLCGNFKECNPKTGEWRCPACDKWLLEHYGRLRDAKLKKDNEIHNSKVKGKL